MSNEVINNKDHMQKRNFKPIKLADSLQAFNKDLVNKFGKIDYVIYSKWAEIVGTFFAKYSQPEKITKIPQFYENQESEHQKKVLHVNVSSGVAVEFQHFQNKIIEKINSFFGYQVIHQIIINQKFFPKNSDAETMKISKLDNNLSDKKINEIKDTIQKINDKELEKSLLNLGLSIAKNEDN